jgi:hypothetical protein
MRPRVARLFVFFVLAVATSLANVSLVAGTSKTGISVQLPAGHTISGKITRQSNGTVVVGASVSAFGSAGFSFATTNSTGDYVLKALPNGSYTVYVSTASTLHLRDGYFTTANVNHFTLLASGATQIVISGTNATGKYMKLPADPATHSISGKITRATGGAALVGAHVTASGSAGTISATTNSLGNYTIAGLFPGSYILVVEPPSGVNLQSGCYLSTNATTHFTANCGAATHLTISTVNLTGKNVALPNGLTISGTLQNRAASPLAYTSVSANSLGAQFSQSAVTDATGHFLIIGLSPGAFVVEASAPYGVNVLDGFYSSANTFHWVQLESSATHISMTVNKALGIIKPAYGFTIAGKIMNGVGTGLQYASVFASGTAGFAFASTAADGTFTLLGLPAGTYVIQVDGPFTSPTLQSGYYRSGTTGFTPNRTAATIVTLGPSKTGVNIKLPVGLSISGKITRSGGVGVPFATVYAKRVVSGITYYYPADTDSVGNYLIQGLPAGSYKVQIFSVQALNLLGGWYRSTTPITHYTASEASATWIVV